MTSDKWEKDIKFWKTEDVLKLANHFHYLNDENDLYQHVRVHHFKMSSENVMKFRLIGEIDTMKICLAIDTDENETKFRFYPILEMTAVGVVGKVQIPLEPKAIEGDSSESVIVPGIFKDMIQENWNKIDITYIDDLFIAQAQNEEGKLLDQMVRVHEFRISKDMIKVINELNIQVPVEDDRQVMEPNIQEIDLYPGVDMNKFGRKEYISFAPVLGFKHLSNSSTYNRIGIVESQGKETLIEYTLPCPPCKDRRKK
ncbi:MAG: hypothetical protein AB8B56_20680 [Crocinitomicaceae bacterium]